MISNGFDIDFEDIIPCNQEEADIRLILHVLDRRRKGYKKLSIVGSDTDIIVIALYHFYDLDVNKLWVEYSIGQHKMWLPIHVYVKLWFWYIITGCDTVSVFSGCKKTAWNVWVVFEGAIRSSIK